MGQHVCRNATNFIIILLAFVFLVSALVTPGWLRDSNGINYHFLHTAWTFYYYYTGYMDISWDASGYAIATGVTLILSCIFTLVCVVLACVLMCADCCCHITKCMLPIPKVIVGFAEAAGALAEIACAIFLIKVYAVEKPEDSIVSLTRGKKNIVPFYSFFLAVVGGLALMIIGCVNCNLRYRDPAATATAETVGSAVTVSVNTSQSQPQMTAPWMFPPQMYPYMYPGHMYPNSTTMPNGAMMPNGMMPDGVTMPNGGMTPFSMGMNPVNYGGIIPQQQILNTSFVNEQPSINSEPFQMNNVGGQESPQASFTDMSGCD